MESTNQSRESEPVVYKATDAEKAKIKNAFIAQQLKDSLAHRGQCSEIEDTYAYVTEIALRAETVAALLMTCKLQCMFTSLLLRPLNLMF